MTNGTQDVWGIVLAWVQRADHFPIGIYAISEVSMAGAPEHVMTVKQIP